MPDGRAAVQPRPLLVGRRTGRPSFDHSLPAPSPDLHLSQELGDILTASGALGESQLREARGHQRTTGESLEEAVVSLGFADEATVWRALAKANSMPFIDLGKGRVASDVVERMPAEFATEQGVMPVMERDGRLIVAIDDPLKRLAVDQLQFLLGDVDVACAIAAPDALKRAIAGAYGEAAEDTVAVSMGAGAGTGSDDAPIVRLVTRTFKDALDARASDIHIEPGHGRVRIRFRVDGLLRDVAEHPEHLGAPLMSRLKIMARMDIAEKRKPQDGRIALRCSRAATSTCAPRSCRRTTARRW